MNFDAVNIVRKHHDQILLDHVTLSVEPGQRIALVGRSGSGKTLLLRSLALLDPIDGGDIRWNGTAISERMIPEHRARVPYVHQRPSLVEGTVETNLQMPFSLGVHNKKAYDRRRVLQMLKLLGRDESFLRQTQANLSGGETQFVGLMRTIQLDPQILLLDEPTASLDPQSTTAVERLLVNWVQRTAGHPATVRRAFVWVTHDEQQGRRIADRIGRMESGRLALAESSLS